MSSGAIKPLLTTDDELVVAVKKVIKELSHQFARAHYNLDIELAVWSAAAILCVKPEEERTEGFLYIIAFRLANHELTKMRHVFPTDFQSHPEILDSVYIEQDPGINVLTFNTLNDQERRIIGWMINDGLNQKDIAELTGWSKATVNRRWKDIINKLRKENT